ncbi:TonB-dependent receptor plug domain-containing protein [Novosphingobium album (ex Hu et al. 2023)]|uniref:TonB-dependent receptor n=1 Tax=Novosphingobium album (ex Hu et al. 2023) TaxID=2930093 RepID=A0ABT0B5W3_9SPHN|nr:TonB-dependent receptor [Novosphingobium album (ex Hu et al. 2023)]MCJ2180243.1 TonB-dependent receptor [Novosphingobium album (ex Hu et al. 2023)]
MTGILAVGLAGPAFAQASEDQSTSGDQKTDRQPAKADTSDIIVTGTRIRGLAAPTGSNLVTVSDEQIKATGATDATQLLNQTISQLPTFNTLAVGSGGEVNTVPRLGLRGFGNSAGNASGGTATLVLFNGHRVVFTGYGSSDVDPNSIPSDIIGSVQVMPDGGSSAYGSDAVGGVINFVTKKRFDGLEVHLQTNQADHYHANVATITAGKTWDTGSALVSVNFSNNNALLNKHRSWTSVDYTRFGGADYRQAFCPYGSFTVNGTAYAAPDFSALSERPKCEPNANSSLVPKQRRVNVFSYIEQEITPSLKFTVDGFYSRRESSFYTDLNALGTQVTIDATNPYFHPVDGETSQTVAFSYANALGLNRESPQELTSWQVSPGLSYDVDGNWKVSTNFIYGYSRADIHSRNVVSTALITPTNVNPYDTAQMSSALIGSVANFENNYYGVNTLKSAQVSADGSLFTLPGGDVKLAVGGELLRQKLETETRRGPIGTSSTTYLDSSRKVEALYGELYIPIFGADNAQPGLRSLDIAIAGRYDHYSDFGSTFNPRFGVNYRPVNDLLLRANYQTTFTAASLADSGLNANILQVIPVAPGVIKMYVAGTGLNLKPMKGKTYSLGFDWTPKAVSGLAVSATYWHTKLTNIISQALAAYGGSAFASATPYALCGVGYAQYSASANGACTQSQVQMIQDTLGAGNFQPGAGINSVADIFSSGTVISTLIDARRGNFGVEKISGLDFQVSYNRFVSFGTVFAEIGGSYILEKKIAPTPTAPFVDYLDGKVVNPQTSPFGFRASAGATAGPATVRVSMTYSGGYDIPPGTVGQTKIGSFTVFNLSGTLDLGSIAGNESNQLEFGVDNVFDVSPPWNSAQGTSGYPAAGTLGRLVRVGLRTKF